MAIACTPLVHVKVKDFIHRRVYIRVGVRASFNVNATLHAGGVGMIVLVLMVMTVLWFGRSSRYTLFLCKHHNPRSLTLTLTLTLGFDSQRTRFSIIDI